MASILEFKPAAFGSRQEAERNEAAGSADIVLFPGVRYERWTEAPSESDAPPRRRARRRDRLELDD